MAEIQFDTVGNNTELYQLLSLPFPSYITGLYKSSNSIRCSCTFNFEVGTKPAGTTWFIIYLTSFRSPARPETYNTEARKNPGNTR